MGMNREDEIRERVLRAPWALMDERDALAARVRELEEALGELRAATAECLDEFEMVVPPAAAGLPGDAPWQRAQRRLRAALTAEEPKP